MGIDGLHWQGWSMWPYVVATVLAVLAWWPITVRLHRRIRQAIHASMLVSATPEALMRRLLLRSLAAVCFAVALLQPAWGRRELPSATMGRPVLLAVDASRSMHATDVAPERLVRMREVVTRLTRTHPDLRYALAVFAGDAWLRVPFTWDTDYIHEILAQLSPEAIRPQGTDLVRPLDLAIELVEKQGLSGLTMVLITDGEHTGDGSPLDRVEALRQHGIRVLAVAIGDASGAPIPSGQGYVRDRNGDLVMSRPDLETLSELARQTDGAFVHVDSQTLDLDPLSRPLAEIEARQMASIQRSQLIDRAEWPIGIGLVLLLISLLPAGWRASPRTALALVSVLLTGAGCAPDRAAREALDQGDPTAAAAWYARRSAETGDPAALTNLGLSLLRAEQYPQAVSALMAAAAVVSEPTERARILYDAGNAAARAGDLETAASLYRQALALHDDEDTAWNLKVVEAQLKKLQQQYRQQMQQRQQASTSATQAATAPQDGTPRSGAGQPKPPSQQSQQPASSDDREQRAGQPEPGDRQPAQSARTQAEQAPAQQQPRDRVGVLLRKRIENLEEADPMRLQGEEQDLEKDW